MTTRSGVTWREVMDYTSSSSDDDEDRDSEEELVESDHEISSNSVQFVTPETDSKQNSIDFYGAVGINPAINMKSTNGEDYAREMMDLFLKYDLLVYIVNCTNERAEQFIRDNCDIDESSRVLDWRPVTVDEMKKFIGITLLMGIIKKPKIQDYWSTDSLIETPIFSSKECLSRDRFILILKFLRYSYYPIVDHDRKISRIEPLLNYVKEVCQEIYIPEKHITVDESLLLWKGRFLYKQYIPNKRSRFGIKFYELCESSSGYLWNLVMHCGKLEHDDLATFAPSNFKMSERVVLHLSENLLDLGYKIVCDNWFSSQKLADYLFVRKTLMLGTIRVNRGVPKELQNQPTPPLSTTFARDGDTMWVKHVDKKSSGLRTIYLIDTESPASVQATCRYRKGGVCEEVYKPGSILEYNNTMNGVDRADQLIEPYDATRKTYRWFHKCAVHYIQRLLMNALILNNKYNNKKYDLLTFTKLAVTKFLLETGSGRYRSRVTRLLKSSEHYLVRIPETLKKKNPTKRCRVCSGIGIRKESRYQCAACEAPLCMGDCFPKFHS